MSIEQQRDPRVSELIGWTQASMEYSVPIHRIRYAVKAGHLDIVKLPDGKRLLMRKRFEAWLRSRTHAGSSK